MKLSDSDTRAIFDAFVESYTTDANRKVGNAIMQEQPTFTWGYRAGIRGALEALGVPLSESHAISREAKRLVQARKELESYTCPTCGRLNSHAMSCANNS